MRHNSEHGRPNTTHSLYSSVDRENILQGINQLTKTLQILTKCLADRKNLCSSVEQIKMAIIRLASTIPKVWKNIYLRFYSILMAFFRVWK